MNILSGDLAYVAGEIKTRIKLRKTPFLIYVAKDGVVRFERKGEHRRAKDLPDADLIGCYGGSATVADIQDDLRVRYQELTT